MCVYQIVSALYVRFFVCLFYEATTLVRSWAQSWFPLCVDFLMLFLVPLWVYLGFSPFPEKKHAGRWKSTSDLPRVRTSALYLGRSIWSAVFLFAAFHLFNHLSPTLYRLRCVFRLVGPRTRSHNGSVGIRLDTSALHPPLKARAEGRMNE